MSEHSFVMMPVATIFCATAIPKGMHKSSSDLWQADQFIANPLDICTLFPLDKVAALQIDHWMNQECSDYECPLNILQTHFFLLV